MMFLLKWKRENLRSGRGIRMWKDNYRKMYSADQYTDRGHIYYKGMDLSRASKDEIKSIRREIQLIFQDPYGSLDPRQSAYSIIKEAVVTGREKYTEAAVAARVKELLETVELLPEMGDRYPHGNERWSKRRLGIARALACNPELIVCDEPVSALDVSIQAQVINLFQSLQERLGHLCIYCSRSGSGASYCRCNQSHVSGTYC